MGDAVCPIVYAGLLLMLIDLTLATAIQFDNYYNKPDRNPTTVKTEVHVAGKETRLRCQIKDRFRNIQNGLNLIWEYKPCTGGHVGGCVHTGSWSPLCGRPLHPCLPILTLMEPRAENSGLYRCNITLDGSVISQSLYMLQFVEKGRPPPEIVSGMPSSMRVVAPLPSVLQCKIHSPVPPTVRWFRRLDPSVMSSSLETSSHNFIQYLNNTYQLLNCCLVVPLAQPDLYLSKLVFSPSLSANSGFYICLAINDANYTYRETHLQVVAGIKPAEARKSETGSFLGLFMIPAALALIPAVAWIMCLRPRKDPSVDPATERERQLVITHVQPSLQTNTQTVVRTQTLSTDLHSNSI